MNIRVVNELVHGQPRRACEHEGHSNSKQEQGDIVKFNFIFKT